MDDLDQQVISCLLKNGRATYAEIGSVVENADADHVILIPVFIADGWHTRETIPEDLGLTGEVTHLDGKRVFYGAPVGTHPSMANLIAARARDTMTERSVV